MLWEQTRCFGLTCCLELFSLHFPWAFPQFSDPEEANLLVLSAQPRKDSSETPWCHLWQDAGGSWVAVGTVVCSMCVADVFLPQAFLLAPCSTFEHFPTSSPPTPAGSCSASTTCPSSAAGGPGLLFCGAGRVHVLWQSAPSPSSLQLAWRAGGSVKGMASVPLGRKGRLLY